LEFLIFVVDLQGFDTSFKVYPNMNHSKILCLLYIMSIKVHTWRHWNNSKSSCLIITTNSPGTTPRRPQLYFDLVYDIQLQHATARSTTSFTSNLSSLFDFSIVLAIRTYTRRSLDIVPTRNHRLTYMCGTGSVVGIATGYGLDGPGIDYSLFRVVMQSGCVMQTQQWASESSGSSRVYLSTVYSGQH